MANSTPIVHDNLGRGIDQFHPENKVPDGYWEDLVNCDSTPYGAVSKRRGYSRYAGSIPIRVTQIEHSGTNIDLSVDSSFDLTNLRSTPVVVYGRLSSAQSGDFSTTATAKYYSSFTISSGKIRLADSGAVSATYTDASPQLTIWGIEWDSGIRAAGAGSRWGWVNCLEIYRTATAHFPVAGLGGNLYAGRTRADVGSTYKLPRYYPSVRGTVSSETVVGPAIWTTGETPSRTRGYITCDDAVTHWARVSAVQYNSGTGYVDVILSCPNLSVSGTLTDVIEPDKDRLTIRQGVPAKMIGTFLIRSVSSGEDTITLSVDIPAVTDNRYDDTGSEGQAGIFSDVVTLSADAEFLGGDRLASTGLDPDSTAVTCAGTSSTELILGGLDDEITLAASEVIYGTRTSSVLLPRDSVGTRSVTDLVRGDMLDVTGLTRRVRVVNVNPSADRTVAITGDGATATVTVTSGDGTSNLSVGDRLLLRQAGPYSGTVTVTDVPTSTTAEFASTETESVASATLVGKTAGLDEEIELDDTSDDATYVEVHARWIPVEWADPVSGQTPTRTRHFSATDYDNQRFLSVARASDNLYFSDGLNDVWAFDGAHLRRAGLPRWQAAYLGGWHSETPAVIPNSGPSVAISSSDSPLTFTEGGERFVVGEIIAQSSDYDEWGRVTSVEDTAVSTDMMEFGWSGNTVHQSMAFKYYVRLNAVDANNNVIASAQTSSQDMTYRFGSSAQVQLRLLRLPAFDGFDYSRLDLEVYRTAKSGGPPYFRVATIPLDPGPGEQVVTFEDSTPSELQVDVAGADIGALDAIATATVGAELGTAWDLPPRGKYAGSAAGRLLVGNIRAYPDFDISIQPDRDLRPSVFDPASASGTKFIFRRGGSEATKTDNVDCFVYELVYQDNNGNKYPGAKVDEIIPSTDGDSFVIKLTDNPPTGVAAGSWLYLSGLTFASYRLRNDLSYQGHFQVASVSGKELTVNCSHTPSLDISSVSTTDDELTISGGHGIVGDGAGVFLTTTGTLPTGLAKSTQYYAIYVSDTEIKLASSYANAVAGTDIDITGAGSGTHTLHFGRVWGDYGVDDEPPGVIFATDPADIPVPQAYLFPPVTGISRQLSGNQTVADRVWSPEVSRLQAARLLAAAINASQSCLDRSIDSDYRAWLTAGAGNDFGPGQVVVSVVDSSVDDATLEISPVGCDIYVHGVLRASGTEISARTRVFPSRLCRSYPNYPEIFDAPYARSASESDSVVDISPNDGDEIVGFISAFGDSTSGSSQKESAVLVFKRFSVHVVDVESRRVQQLDTGGRGCAYPRSIAHTKNGVMFANEAGLWKINRQLELVYIGKFTQRLWESHFAHDVDADVPVAVHIGGRNKYLISAPITGETENSEALVYDHTQETNPSGIDPDGGLGSWSRYDSHPATAWISRGGTYMGTSAGLVYEPREAGDETDYRDDDQPIVARATYGARSFGTAGIRKLLEAVVVSWRVAKRVTGHVVRAATEIVAAYTDLDKFRQLDGIEADVSGNTTNLSDVERAAVRPVTYTVPERRANHFQLQFENSDLDEGMEITQLDFLVLPLDNKGVPDAGSVRD